jgi:hypothetical protein
MLFQEQKKLQISFYFGFALIAISVAIQMVRILKTRNTKIQ